MAGARLVTLSLLYFGMSTAASFHLNAFRPDGSQVPSLQKDSAALTEAEQGVDPRVGWSATSHPRASSAGAKIAGRDSVTQQNSFLHSSARKRAYKRACKRAARAGATTYRGRLVTAAELQAAHIRQAEDNTTRQPTSGPTGVRQSTDRRVRMMTWNCGGMNAELYDVLCSWLQKNPPCDVLVLQEVHHGFGKQDATWSIKGWSFVLTANPDSRYSGVAMVISHRIARPHQITFCSWLPGRLLHVKCDLQGLVLDLVGIYQWVRQSDDRAANDARRAQFWVMLGKLLSHLPKRNLLVVLGDFNTPVEHLPGHIGRGLLRSDARGVDQDLQLLLQVQGLVPLNTWRRAGPAHTATFLNGAVTSQIDFIAVRKEAADLVARTAAPSEVNLAPWRLGPRHRPVVASAPWVAGWRLRQRTARRGPAPPAFSKAAMQECLRISGPELPELRSRVEHAFKGTTPAEGLPVLNRKLLHICSSLFPQTRKQSARPGSHPNVVQRISEMWYHYREFKACRRQAPARALMRVWAAYARFRRSWTALRTASRAERRRWLTEQIRLAHNASLKQDMTTVYRVVRLLAPKQRKDQVRIRSEDGHLLSQRQQFEAIFGYFATAFRRTDAFESGGQPATPTVSEEDLCKCICSLKPRKAVPVGCPPAEIWQVCPKASALFFQGLMHEACAKGGELPKGFTDCSLLLLPKPGKKTRLPKDLRPLGLQDPASKILASVIKAQLETTVLPWLLQHKQYAYCPGRSIDEAVARAAAHCRRVRQLLKESQDSVHSRRAGCTPLQCGGGATLSIDLSRAFDQLPRWALAKSLQHAGIDDSMISLIVAIHEGCTYSVQHATYAGNFPLQVGVRQGCALAPLLFCIFSCWISDMLDTKLGVDWCARHHTAFADDNLVQWVIQSESDLHRMCVQIQVLFDLLHEVGMSVNVLKSGLLIKLRGPAAKRWLRGHVRRTAEGEVISVGTPGRPVELPRQTDLTYLGIKLSYGNFELQSCLHRLRAARLVRQRLVKLLHSSGLRLKLRLQLYSACVRSSLLYALHAVGLTPSAQQRLSAADARFVRAIARNPVHLTRTSNLELYRKLKLRDVPALLAKLLAGRARKSTDPEATAAFQAHLCVVRAWQQQTWQCHQHGLRPAEAGRMLPCDICGVYFSTMQHLLSHKARIHGTMQPRKTSVMPSRQYTASAVDGMPICAHCGASFTRVEALKKHLKQACPALFQQRLQCTPSVPPAETKPQSPDKAQPAENMSTPLVAEVKVATVSKGLLGSSDRAPTPVQGVLTPLVEAPAFRRALRQGWKHVVRSREFVCSLRQYCVLCGQWVDATGVKQHHRLMHGEQWALKTEACSRIGSLGLVVSSPCHYCEKQIKDPRAHLRACPVTYQASLAELVIRQEPHVLSGGGDSSHLGSPGDARRPGHGQAAERRQCGTSGEEGTHGKHGTGRLEEGQVCQAGPEGLGRQGILAMGQLEAVDRHMAGRREGRPGYDGCGSCHTAAAVRIGQTGHTARGGAVQDPHRHDADMLSGHGSLGNRAASPESCGGLGDAVRGRHRSHASEGDPPPEHLRGGGAADHVNPPGRGEAGQGQRMAVVAGGEYGTGSMLDVLPMESAFPPTGTQPPAADQELGHPTQVGLPGQELGGGWSSDEVQGDETHVKHGSLRQCSLAVFLLPESQRRHGSQKPRGHQGHGELLGSEADRHADQAGARGAPTIGVRAGEGLPSGAVHRLAGEATLDQAQRQAGSGEYEGLGALNAPAPVQLSACTMPELPMAQLQNPHQICYLNSVAQALCWVALLTDDAASCGGKARSAIMLAQRAHKPYLPDCIAWHQVLRGWAQLKQQHDAGMFLAHVLHYAAPVALRGTWQARLCNPDTVTDEGPLTSPILLEVQGQDLQSAVHHWHRQHTIHAIDTHGGVLVLQLNRYSFVDGAPRKVNRPVCILPGAIIQVPIFTAGGIEVCFRPFRVAFVIFHLGDRVTSGHYQTALCSCGGPEGAQRQDDGQGQWAYQLCNDRCKPRAATARDLDCIHHNAYLVGLLNSPSAE